MTALSSLLVAVALAQPSAPGACPVAEQPMLSQGLNRMIVAGRADDALDCIRAIKGRYSTDALSDEVRYQLALLTTEAIGKLTQGGAPVRSDARDVADLWNNYLTFVSEPYDQVRINTALSTLMQYGRYDNFPKRIEVVAKGLAKAKAAVRVDVANLLFSTIKRCPYWTRVSERLACTAECSEVAKSALGLLEMELGKLPWAGSEGLSKMTANAQALTKESASCGR